MSSTSSTSSRNSERHSRARFVSACRASFGIFGESSGILPRPKASKECTHDLHHQHYRCFLWQVGEHISSYFCNIVVGDHVDPSCPNCSPQYVDGVCADRTYFRLLSPLQLLPRGATDPCLPNPSLRYWLQEDSLEHVAGEALVLDHFGMS